MKDVMNQMVGPHLSDPVKMFTLHLPVSQVYYLGAFAALKLFCTYAFPASGAPYIFSTPRS